MCGRSQGERENFLLPDHGPSYRILGLDATSLQVFIARTSANYRYRSDNSFIGDEKIIFRSKKNIRRKQDLYRYQ